jgi:hypothetical protein
MTMSYLPIANKSDMTTCKVNLIVPVRGVQERALVLVDILANAAIELATNGHRIATLENDDLVKLGVES